jgi:hypothetical protein
VIGAVIIAGFLVFVVAAAAREFWRGAQLRRWAERRAREELRPRKRWHGG